MCCCDIDGVGVEVTFVFLVVFEREEDKMGLYCKEVGGELYSLLIECSGAQCGGCGGVCCCGVRGVEVGVILLFSLLIDGEADV